MPTVTFEPEDLYRLLGFRLPLERLEQLLPLIKCEVKEASPEMVSVEVTADRPDLFSAEGIARLLKGFLGKAEGSPKYRVAKSRVKVKVSRMVRRVRPRIVCAVVRGVSFTESSIAQLMQLQEKLHETLCRRRSKASIGIYDLDKVKPPITYTALKPEKIRFTPLEESKPLSAEEILTQTSKGLEYAHLLRGLPRYPLLVDREGQVLSMPPIINSEETKVTVETRNLFIDATGFNPELLEEAVSVLVSSLAERGAKVEAVQVEYEGGGKVWTCQLKPRKMTVNPAEVNRLLGFNLPSGRMAKLLRRMRFDVEASNGRLKVSIPPFRSDILHPVDLAEEVAIAYGYHRIKPEPLRLPTVGSLLPASQASRRIRSLIAGYGFQETASYLLSSRETQFERMGVKSGEAVELANPTSQEYSIVRVWLLPCLLEFLSKNVHVDYPQKVFELGDVVLPDVEAETATRVETRLAAAICNFKVSYEDVQALAYSLLEQLGVEGWRVEAFEHPSFLPGRTARLLLGEVEIGLLGEIHPAVLEAFRLVNPVAAMELNLSKIFPETFKGK
ncbi:MAG: phenylalanine--tRNA ligase subunit beta [Candidatus Hecatellales archaeon]|nr:MAG: phenylalanine--tRNA ligase subunit beta [Candidatus Hecatellales archaeon]